MEETSGDLVCGDNQKDFQEQDGLLNSSVSIVYEVEEPKEKEEIDVNETADTRCSVSAEGEAKVEQGSMEPHESKEGLISGIKDDSCDKDAGNVNSHGGQFQQHETAEALNDASDSCLSMAERTEGLESDGNLDVSDLVPQPPFAVNENSAHDDALAGNESREGNATPNESVNTDVEIQNFKVDGEAEKEVTELHDEHKLVNGSNRETGEERSEDVSSLQHLEKIEHGLQQCSGRNDIPEKISPIQDCKKGISVSWELSGLIKCTDSISTGLGEREDLFGHSDGQGLGEQAITLSKMGVEVQGGVCDSPILEEGCIPKIPGTSVEQHCANDAFGKEHHSVADNVVAAPHFLPSSNEGSEKGIRDSLLGLNKFPPDISNPLVRQDETCKHDGPVVENSTSFEDLQKRFCLDAFPLSEEAKKEQQIKGNIQAHHNEEPSAEVFSTEQKTVISLAATIQSKASVLTFVEDEGTSKAVNCFQEEEDIPLRDLMQTKGKKCGQQSMPAAVFIFETEKTEPTKSEASVFGKADMAHNTNEYQKLENQLTNAGVSNLEFSAKEFEATSACAKQFFDLLEEKEKNLQNRLPISPSLQLTKKHRHRKSSIQNSNTERLSLGNCLPEHKYSVGDLVWGKVRSHPWWPGQIFDPSDASESASKIFQRVRKDRLLVAFFGDATFGWCEESQLMLFQSNFSEKAKQTSTKAFQNAVMDALDELARRVELGLTCSCQVEEARHILESKAMDNFGIRQGAIVNDHNDIVQAISTFDPLKFLSTIQDFAKLPHMDRDLEITVACAQASAFLTFKGLLVSGKISLVTSENRIVSEEKQRSAELVTPSQSQGGSSGKHKRKTEEKHPRRTKKRKINDLIAECQPSYEAEEDLNGDDVTLLEMAGRIKKRKINDLIAACERSGEAEEDLNGCNETLLDIAVARSYAKSKHSKGMRANSQKCQESEPTSTKTGEDTNTAKMIVKKAKSDVAKPIEEGSMPRRESPLKAKQHQKSESAASHIVNNDSKALKSKKEFNSISLGIVLGAKRTPKSCKFGECIKKVASELASTPPDSKAASAANAQKRFEQGRKSAEKVNMNICSSRSTKKETVKPKEESVSTCELLSELLIVARDPLFWAKKKKMPFSLINSFLQFRNAVFEKSSTNADVIKASVLNFVNESNELKSPQSSSKFPGSFSTADSKDIEWTDRESSLRPKNHVGHEKLKRKAEFSVAGARKKTKRTVRLPSPPWSSKGLKNEPEDKIGDRYGKRYSRRLPVASLTRFSTDSNPIQNPGALFMRFPKSFALPSEIELKAKFARFGPLEISETKVFRRSGCAQVVFKTISAAEAAFNFASENKIFGSARVNFRLRYPSSGTQADTIENKDNGKHKRIDQPDGKQSPSLKDMLRDGGVHQETILQPTDSIALSTERPSTCRPNTPGEPQLLLIQQNLEMLTSMLSRSDCTSTSATATSDNITPDSKRDIMDEMMSLLQKVSALVSSPP